MPPSKALHFFKLTFQSIHFFINSQIVPLGFPKNYLLIDVQCTHPKKLDNLLVMMQNMLV